MGLSVVYCPDCGEGFFQRNGVAASVAWAEHYRDKHTDVSENELVSSVNHAIIEVRERESPGREEP